MSPNTTGRGHPPRVGGNDSQGTIQKGVKISKEVWKALTKKYGRNFLFSDYIRGLIEKDLQGTK
jgi:hypothetical protein